MKEGKHYICEICGTEYNEPLMLIPQRYFLKSSDVAYLSFRKSHVKNIKEVRE